MRRFGPALGVVVGVAVWIGFPAMRVWVGMPYWYLMEAGSSLIAGGALVASAEWYRRITGSRLGYSVVAVILVIMLALTMMWSTLVGTGLLLIAVIAAAIGALRGLDMRQDLIAAVTEDKTTRLIWIAAAIALPVTYVVIAAVLGFRPGIPVIHVSEAIRSEFNTLSVLLAPPVVVIVLGHGVACWSCITRMRSRTLGVLCVLGLTFAAATIPLLLGFSVGDPFPALTYFMPLVVNAAYVVAFPNSRLVRVLAIGALAVAIGMSLFVLGAALVGAETD
jgi:hypothetical protein